MVGNDQEMSDIEYLLEVAYSIASITIQDKQSQIENAFEM